VILKAREERVREIETRENSLGAIDRMIDLRSGAGRSSGVTGDTGLQNMHLEIRQELTSARARLARLERKVRQDFGGEYPPWWPKGRISRLLKKAHLLSPSLRLGTRTLGHSLRRT